MSIRGWEKRNLTKSTKKDIKQEKGKEKRKYYSPRCPNVGIIGKQRQLCLVNCTVAPLYAGSVAATGCMLGRSARYADDCESGNLPRGKNLLRVKEGATIENCV